MNSARITVHMGDARQAQAVHAALQPEVRDGPEGSVARLLLDEVVITAEIEAHDVSSLRAALNGILRLLDTARRATEDPKDHKC